MKGKVVIVTGASSGIGLALTEKLAQQGACIAIASRNIEKLNNIAEDFSKKYECNLLAVKTDVSIEGDCKNLIEKTITHYGKIDILINNAGISMRASFLDVDLEVIRKLMNVNFFGTVYCTKFALPHLIETKGTLVGVTSIAGFHGLPGRTGYSASKFALNGFLETIRIENLKNGLNVIISAPGFTTSNVRKSALTADGSPQGETPLNEEKMMKAEDVAKEIIVGIKKRRRNIIHSWQGKLTVLVQRIIPRVLDNVAYKFAKGEPNSPIK
jgi:short-subunit dehydrogenase